MISNAAQMLCKYLPNRKQENFFCVCVSVICKAAVTKGCETSWDSVSRSCRGVLFQSLWEGEEILWILPVWAQGSQSEQGGLVWELLLIYETHTHTHIIPDSLCVNKTTSVVELEGRETRRKRHNELKKQKTKQETRAATMQQFLTGKRFS